MKKTLLLFAAAAAMAAGSLPATPVFFSLLTLTGSTASNNIYLTPDPVAYPVLGTNFVPLQPVTLQPFTGQITTNLQPWGWNLLVSGWTHPIHIIVPQDTNTWNATSLINTNAFNPQFILVVGSVAGGSNTTVTVSNGVYIVSSTGGGSANVAAGNGGIAVTNTGGTSFIYATGNAANAVSKAAPTNAPIPSVSTDFSTVFVPTNYAAASVTNLTPGQLANVANAMTNLPPGLVTNDAPAAIVVTGAGANTTISSNTLAVTGAGASSTIASNLVTTPNINYSTVIQSTGTNGFYADQTGTWFLNNLLHGDATGGFSIIGTPFEVDSIGDISAVNGFFISRTNSDSALAGISLGDAYAPNGDWRFFGDMTGTLTGTRFGTPGNTNDGIKFTIDQAGNANFRSSGTTVLNSSNLTGTVSDSVLSPNIVLTNATQTLFNDTNANWFLNSVGVGNFLARQHLQFAVNDLKIAGVWSSLTNGGDIVLFGPNFNPAKHRTLLGNTFLVTNETYNNEGFLSALNNSVVMPLTANTIVSNFTYFVMYRENAAQLDNFLGGYTPMQLAASLVASDNSDVALEEHGSQGARVWLANHGVFVSSNNWQVVSNRINSPQSGAFRNDPSAIPFNLKVYIVTGTTNGLVQTWVNGRLACFGNSGTTNSLYLTNITAAFSTFLIGGGDSKWNSINSGEQATNANGCDFVVAGVLNQACDSNCAAAIYKFCTDVLDDDKVVEWAGSSILNNPGYGGSNPVGVPITNCSTLLYEQSHPRTLVIESASPGSYVANWTNQVNGSTNGVQFQPVVLLINPDRYPSRTFKTDGPRNDGFLGTSPAASNSRISPFINQLSTNGIAVEFLITPWTWQQTLANNVNWITTAYFIYSNNPSITLRPVNVWYPSNYLALISQDTPPTHFDAPTIQGQQGNMLFNSASDGQPVPPASWWTYSMVSSTTLPDQFTNLPNGMANLPFDVVDPLTGSHYYTLDGPALTNLTLANITGIGNAASADTNRMNVSGATNVWGQLNLTNLPPAAATNNGSNYSFPGASVNTATNIAPIPTNWIPANGVVDYAQRGFQMLSTNANFTFANLVSNLPGSGFFSCVVWITNTGGLHTVGTAGSWQPKAGCTLNVTNVTYATISGIVSLETDVLITPFR